MSSAEGKRPTRAARRKREFVRFVIIFLYLWVLFGLFVLNERIILGQRGIGFAPQGFAIVNALVLAKVMLIAEDLKLGVRWRNRPLIFSIVADSALFAGMFLIVHVIERVVAGVINGRSAEASIPTIGGGGLPGVACVSAILFFALIPYFTFAKVAAVIGADRLKAILFKAPDTVLPMHVPVVVNQ